MSSREDKILCFSDSERIARPKKFDLLYFFHTCKCSAHRHRRKICFAEKLLLRKKNQSKNSTSNKVAKELKDRRYHQRVVRSKKIYDRKKFQNNSRDS